MRTFARGHSPSTARNRARAAAILISTISPPEVRMQTWDSHPPDGLRVKEQLVVQDLDPRDAQAKPRLFRKAEGERSVRAGDARLVATGRSVWATVVSGAGR